MENALRGKLLFTFPGQGSFNGDILRELFDRAPDRQEFQLADEITLIPTPGHSPGHHSVHVRSRGEEALLAGDVMHHPCQMAHLDWSSTADSDPAQSVVTRRELFSRFADTPTLVIGGHFSAGHIKRDVDAFRFAALDNL